MPLDPVSAIPAIAQTILGTIQTIRGGIETKRLTKQLKAFQTPGEAVKILNATESMASQGFDSFTLDYLNNSINKGASSSLGVATRLGADPNNISAIFGKQIEGLMKVGVENHQENMANFSKYLGALDMMSKNKEAEWASRQNMIKDKIQAANPQVGMQNLQNAANAFISLNAASKISGLQDGQSPKLGKIVNTYGDATSDIIPNEGGTNFNRDNISGN